VDEYDLMSACYKEVKDRPDLYLFARGLDRKRFSVRLRGIKPRFYAPWNEVSESVRLSQEPILDFKDRAVARIYTDLPRHVGKKRRLYSFTDEADIEFEKVALNEKGIFCGFKIVDGDILPTESHNIAPRVAIGDIEVMSPPEIMPVPTNPVYPVVSVCFLDTYTLKRILFILQSRAKIYWPSSEYEEVVYCKTEWELFNFTAEYMLRTEENTMNGKFDVWTGWWWKHYDVPYLFYRAPYINFDFRKFSPIRSVRMKPHPKKPRNYMMKIGGIETTDLLEQYRVLTKPGGKKLTWDLKYIVQKETKGKTIPPGFCMYCENIQCEYKGTKTTKPIKCKGFVYTDYGDVIEKIHAQDHKTMIKYCFNDVIAAYLIDQIRNLTQHFDTARRLRGCFVSDAHSAYRVHKSFLLRLSTRPLPTNFFGYSEGPDIPVKDTPLVYDKPPIHVTGAYVRKPDVGLHSNVGVVDIRSIYPMIIENLNASPESLSKDGTLVAANGTRFKKTPLALFPKAVRVLRKEREYFRGLKDSLTMGSPEWHLMWTREQATKYDVRSFYGATRNVDPRVTQAVTATGVFILKVKTIPYIEKKLGYKVVYGDTDSAHIKFKSDNWREGLLLEKALNEYYVKLSDELGFTEKLELKFEEFFSNIFYKAKKRWAGFCTIRDKKPYNQLIIMGLQAKRSDSSILTVGTMKQFMSDVNLEGEKEKAAQTVSQALKDIRELPMQDIAIPKGLQRELHTYKHFLMAEAVKWSKKHLKIRFRQDKRPRLLYGYVKGHPYPKLGKRKTRAFAIQDEPIDGAVIDYDVMIQKTLRKPFEPLLQAIGLDWSSVTSSSRPSQLSEWM